MSGAMIQQPYPGAWAFPLAKQPFMRRCQGFRSCCLPMYEQCWNFAGSCPEHGWFSQYHPLWTLLGYGYKGEELPLCLAGLTPGDPLLAQLLKFCNSQGPANVCANNFTDSTRVIEDLQTRLKTAQNEAREEKSASRRLQEKLDELAISEVKQLREEREAARSDVEKLCKQLQEAGFAAEERQKQLEAAISEVKQLREEREAARSEAKQLREQLDAAKSSAEQLQEQLEAASRSKDQQLEEARSEAERLRKHLVDALAENLEMACRNQQAYVQQRGRLAAAQDDVKALRTENQHLHRELEAAQATAGTEHEQQRRQLAAAQGDVNALRTENQQLRLELLKSVQAAAAEELLRTPRAARVVPLEPVVGEEGLLMHTQTRSTVFHESGSGIHVARMAVEDKTAAATPAPATPSPAAPAAAATPTTGPTPTPGATVSSPPSLQARLAQVRNQLCAIATRGATQARMNMEAVPSLRRAHGGVEVDGAQDGLHREETRRVEDQVSARANRPREPV